MELKYVGDLPKVSKNGVAFDHTKVDKYTYLTAVVELLEAHSFGATETTEHLYRAKGKELTASELLELLKKFCNNLDEVFQTRDEKSNALVQGLIDRVNENDSLSDDERKAWLKNIDIMTDYYLQYVTNASAYECALNILAEQVKVAQIKEISIPLFRNYGIVLHDLKPVLAALKSPIDTDMEVNTTDDGLLATVIFSHR